MNWNIFRFFRKSAKQNPIEEFLCVEHIKSSDLRQAWRHISSTPQGRLCISHLLNSCGITSFSRVRNNDDRLRQEGRRQLGFGILEMLALDEHQLQQVIMNRVQTKATASATRPTHYERQ